MTDEELSRMEMEVVFRLESGELSDEFWPLSDRPEDEDRGFAYWYEGIPHYAMRDYPDRFDAIYRTAIAFELFGRAKTPEGWERVSSYSSSGGGPCWCGENNPDCPLCEGQGEVFVGDGWHEVVYREIEEE